MALSIKPKGLGLTGKKIEVKFMQCSLYRIAAKTNDRHQ